MAAAWFRQAAELKHLKAQTNLALMLWIGRGCEKDQKLALEWIRKAAKDGYEPAIDLLETMRKKQGGS